MIIKRLVLIALVFLLVSCSADESEPECVNYTDCPQGFDCVDGFCVEGGQTETDEDQKTVLDNSEVGDETEEFQDYSDESEMSDEAADEAEDIVEAEDDMDTGETVDENSDEADDETEDLVDEEDDVFDDSDQSDESEVSDETVDNEVPDDYIPSCGNGIVDTGEDCDDGKNDNGDGCDLGCNFEAGFKCSGNPSICAKVFYNEINLMTESATNIPVCSYVKVVFSQAMNDTSASLNVFLEKGGTKIALTKVKASGDNKEYTYYPAFNSGTIIDVDAVYSVVVGKDIETQSGDKTSADLNYAFSASTNDLYFENFEKNYSPWDLETVWEIGTPNYPYDGTNYPADKEITVGYDGSANTLGTIMDGFYTSDVDGEIATMFHPIYLPYSGASMSFYAHVDTEKGSPEWYDGMSIVVFECTSSSCFGSPGTSVSILENSDTSSIMTISGYTDLIGNFYIGSTSSEHYGIRGKEQTDNTYQQFTVHFPNSFAGKWIFPVFKFYSDTRFNHPGIYIDNISIGY